MPTERVMSREEVIEAVSKDGSELKDHPEFQGDREVVKSAVMNDGMALEYASDDLKEDREIVAYATRENPEALSMRLTIFGANIKTMG